MNLSKALLSVLVASTMVMSSVASAVDAVALQQGAISQMKELNATLTSDMTEYNRLAGVLGEAKKTASGYRIDLNRGGNMTSAGAILFPLAGGARAYQQVAKQRGRLVIEGKKVTNILMAFAALIYVGGVALERNGAQHIDSSEADVLAAVSALNEKRDQIIHNRKVVAGLAADLGVKVTLDSKENVISGLENLQTIMGSGVMAMPVPAPYVLPQQR